MEAIAISLETIAIRNKEKDRKKSTTQTLDPSGSAGALAPRQALDRPGELPGAEEPLLVSCS